MIDIIDRIDEVTSSVCGWCSAKLTADDYSGDFCSEGHQESWNRDRAGLTATVPRVASALRHSPDGDEIVVRIVPDMSRFENALRVAFETAGPFIRAIAGNRISHAIIDETQLGGWTDVGFTTGGVLEADPAAEQSSQPTRAERMQAALEARRNRNTGPQHRPRAPKNLGGRTPR
ncbi:hypothetical protein [Amycolatopsis sp. cmx-4-83]|uniref:hypothetical protein n=1 Tax=Amycolatopsis sp. cmx-4-83 TaxID=2790940 RepID=UPI00397912DC